MCENVGGLKGGGGCGVRWWVSQEEVWKDSCGTGGRKLGGDSDGTRVECGRRWVTG